MTEQNRSWIVTVDMGYGHLRAAFALKHMSDEDVIFVETDKSTTESEQNLWRRFRVSYEWLSRIKAVPLVGGYLFSLLDKLLDIPPLYPLTDMSQPTFQVKTMDKFITRGLCSGVMTRIADDSVPMITTFYAPSLAATVRKRKNSFCVITDADFNRAWVPPVPDDGDVHYLMPTHQAYLRAQSYGIPESRIHLTGFPLCPDLLGKNQEVLVDDMKKRLHRLDHNRKFISQCKAVLEKELGSIKAPKRKEPLTITFAVGGAGAQKEIGIEAMEGLRPLLESGEVVMNLVAGIRAEVHEVFLQARQKGGFTEEQVHIQYSLSREKYFRQFNDIMRRTDILWTKPSELSFFAGLGIPIIMAPPIGSQEIKNRQWLLEMQAAVDQRDPASAALWIIHLKEAGFFTRAAWNGYSNIISDGAYRIEKVVKSLQ